MGMFGKASKKLGRAASRSLKSASKSVAGQSKGPSNPGGSRSSKNTSSDELAFLTNSKEPDRDQSGRVIVKLSAGKEIELGVWLQESSARWLVGKPDFEKFEVTRNVKVHLVSNSSRYVLVSPAGDEFAEVNRDSADLANDVFEGITSSLRGMYSQLANEVFAFEVSLRLEGEWQEEDVLEDSWLDVSESFVRIKNPVEFEIE